MSTQQDVKHSKAMNAEDLIKPVPRPLRWSEPFWEGARQGHLLLKHCLDCGHIDHPPYLFCTECGSERSEWRRAKGVATLAAFAVNTYGVPTAFTVDLPYVLAMVDLPEGPRMISNIVECDHAQLRNGMSLEVVFHRVDEKTVLPKWRPVIEVSRRE